MSDTLRQAITDRMRAYPNDSNMHWWADILADDIMAVVLADPTVARWKAAEEAAAYFISSYPTDELAEERQWDLPLDALAKAVTPTASDSTIDSRIAGRPLEAAQTPESTQSAKPSKETQ